MEENRNEDGKYSQSYSDSSFIEAVRDLPVASTQNVAEKVGCSYNLAYRRLGNLFKKGELEREEVGNSFVYYMK